MDQSKLKGTTFYLKGEPPPPAPRLVMGIYGPPKVGKTTWAIQAPGPVCYQGIDIGHEGVIEDWVRAGLVFPAVYPYPHNVRKPEENVDKYLERVMADAEKIWQSWDGDYQAAMLAGARSVVWDTGDEIYEVLKMSYHGRLTKIMPRDNAPVNQLYSARVRACLTNRKTNFIVIHKDKELWKNDKSTGQFVAAGYNKTEYNVQVMLQFGKKIVGSQPVFTQKITACRMNRDLEGHTFENATFQEIATLLMPDVDPSNWD